MKNRHNCSGDCIALPPAVRDLKTAQSKVAEHWPDSELKFTLDGRLLGDIAEAIVAEQFGLLFPHQHEPKKKRTKGVDLWTVDGKCSVQVKCSAVGLGPAYSSGDVFADWLVFGLIRFESGCFEIVYNGPEEPIRKPLGKITGTKRVELKLMIDQNRLQTQRLTREK